MLIFLNELFIWNSQLHKSQVQNWKGLNTEVLKDSLTKLAFWQQKQQPIMQFIKCLLYPFCLIIGVIDLTLTVYLKYLSDTWSNRYIVCAQRALKDKHIQLLHYKLTRKVTPQTYDKEQNITVISNKKLQQGLSIYFFNWNFPQGILMMFTVEM